VRAMPRSARSIMTTSKAGHASSAGISDEAVLPKAGLAERNATPLQRIRNLGPAGHGAVEALFAAKGESKSQVTVTVTKLCDCAAMEQQTACWKAALDRLQPQVER